MEISKNLDENITVIKSKFDKWGDIVEKKFVLSRPGWSFEEAIYVVYIDGLCDHELIENTIIKPVTWEWRDADAEELWDRITSYEGQTADYTTENDLNKVIKSVLKGDTAIFVSGSDAALVVSSKRFPVRGIEESSSEGGMRDSFNENFRTSTALIRRRIKDTELKLEQNTIGRRSRTEYGIMYIKDIARPELIQKVRETLDTYDIDAVFDSGMAEHLMEKKWQEIFPTYQSTTRPDKAAAALVDGRVVVVFDNSPEVVIAPATINTFFQTADDYYNRWPVATFARIIRYLAAFIAVGLPGLYIAITCYHREIIPDKLLYAIADARSQLSFPVVVEVLIMELLFELLREAGIRLPSQLGNTIGVVGGLIVGQSTVEAGIVSTMVVIVVALTAIYGILGFILAMLMLVFHLASLESFGVPYMSPVVTCGYTGDSARDFIVKSPIRKLVDRPGWSRLSQRRRLTRKR